MVQYMFFENKLQIAYRVRRLREEPEPVGANSLRNRSDKKGLQTFNHDISKPLNLQFNLRCKCRTF